MKAPWLAALACVALATPAAAQYFGGFDRPPPPDEYLPPGRYDPYGRPPPPPYYRRGLRGGACVTSRGVCPAPGIPYGYGCRCIIPGFGPKRGIVQ